MEVTPNGNTLGWGAMVLTRAASPLAAEWAGKLEAWRLAETLGVGPAAV